MEENEIVLINICWKNLWHVKSFFVKNELQEFYGVNISFQKILNSLFISGRKIVCIIPEYTVHFRLFELLALRQWRTKE